MSYEVQFALLQGLTGVLALGVLGAGGWLVRTVWRYRR